MKRLKTKIIIETLKLAGLLGLFFLFLGQPFVALGIALGAFSAIVCFQLLSRHILAAASVGLQKIKPYFFLKYLSRYVIMCAMLFICAEIDLRLFLGAAGGLLLISIGCFIHGLMETGLDQTISKR